VRGKNGGPLTPPPATSTLENSNQQMPSNSQGGMGESPAIRTRDRNLVTEGNFTLEEINEPGSVLDYEDWESRDRTQDYLGLDLERRNLQYLTREMLNSYQPLIAEE
jgi:hypothetical protein